MNYGKKLILVQTYSGLKFGDAAKNNVKMVTINFILWASWRSYLFWVSLFNKLILAFRELWQAEYIGLAFI